MTTITTSATYKTQITGDLPDWGTYDVTFELVASFFNGAGEEVIAGKTYVMTLDASGNDSGSFYLPTPDNTGDAGVNWRLTLPSGHLVVVTVAYSASSQSVSDLIAAGSTTTDPDVITSALASKANKVTGATAGNLASLTAAGDLGDSGYAAADFDAAGSAAAAIASSAQRASNLSDLASAATAFANIKQAATTSASGVAALATKTEAEVGLNDAKITTPAGVAAAMGMVRHRAYYEKNLAVRPSQCLAYWRMAETSGTTANDARGVTSAAGTYLAGVDHVAGANNQGGYAAYWDGAGSESLNVYTPLLSVFDGAEGTVFIRARVGAASTWTDATNRYIYYLRADSNNYVRIYKTTNANTISFEYKAGATSETTSGTVTTLDWFDLALTWSKTADTVRFFVDGVAIGTSTALGTWAGSLAATTAVIGASSSAGAAGWHGYLADAMVFNKALLPSEIAELHAQVKTVPTGSLYVNGSTGNDNNIGTIAAAPLATIGAAETLAASDYTIKTIEIATGTYQETISPPRNDLIYVSSGTVTIDGQSQANNGANVVCDNVRLEGAWVFSACAIGLNISAGTGFYAENTTVSGCATNGALIAGNNAYFDNCTFHGNGAEGIKFANGTGGTCINCTGYNNVSRAFYVRVQTGVKFINCYAYAPASGYGFEVEAGANDCKFYNCWATGGSHGFISKTSTGTLFHKCVSWGNDTSGFYAKDGDDGFIVNCDSYGNNAGILLDNNLGGDPSTGWTILNTIMANNATYCISVLNSSTITRSDYNDFYPGSGGGSYGNWQGVAKTSLADWRTASSQDTNSVSIDPEYDAVTYGNFVPAAAGLVGAGTDNGTLAAPDLGHTAAMVEP